MYIKGVTKHDTMNQIILVAGIKAALLDTTGIKLASKSETTSHTYQHQALVDQLRSLIVILTKQVIVPKFRCVSKTRYFSCALYCKIRDALKIWIK